MDGTGTSILGGLSRSSSQKVELYIHHASVIKCTSGAWNVASMAEAITAAQGLQ